MTAPEAKDDASNTRTQTALAGGQVTSERVEERAHRVVVDPPRLDKIALASARLVLLRFYIFSSRSFRTLPDSERHPLSFTQLIKGRRDTAGLMKKVLRTVRRSDEPKALVSLALDRAGGRCHAYIFSISATERRAFMKVLNSRRLWTIPTVSA